MSVKIKCLRPGHTEYVNGKEKWASMADRFGNLGVQFVIENTDETRVIKYVCVELSCKNLVGDSMGKQTVKITGPISPKKSDNIGSKLLNTALHTYTFERLWRVQKYATVEVTQVDVEYMDGFIEKIDVKEATYDPDLEKNSEKIKSFKNFKRSSKDKLIGGVCSAIGERLEITPWIFRALFIFLQPFGIITYTVLCLAVAKE